MTYIVILTVCAELITLTCTSCYDVDACVRMCACRPTGDKGPDGDPGGATGATGAIGPTGRDDS